jgi:hypothetical protein
MTSDSTLVDGLARYSWTGVLILIASLGLLFVVMLTDGWPVRSHRRTGLWSLRVLVCSCLLVMLLRFSLLRG